MMNSRQLLTQSRVLLAELLGTFALTLVAAGAMVIDSVSGGQIGRAAALTAPGLVVMAMIYSIGDISGAHINPAVTFSFAVRGVFPWREVPLYWVAQVAGAVFAAALLRAFFGVTARLGANMPHHGVGTSLGMEIVLTYLLVFVILNTASGPQLVGVVAALAVGGTVTLDGLFASPISGASMNPARSLGPSLVNATTGEVWIYLIGPFIGGLLATVSVVLLRGTPSRKERDAAEGEMASERQA